MIPPFGQNSHHNFAAPGTVTVSASALAYARAFGDAVKASRSEKWVVAFSWAESISVKRERGGTYEDIGACLTLGAYRRHEIPSGFVHSVDGLEFAVEIPDRILATSARRLIDTDQGQFFKLALR
jgi:hypothetical protein